MVSARETANALYGAYRLAARDPGGMAFFDISIGGFWRSFFAAVLIAPLFAVLLSVRYRLGLADAPLERFIAIEAITYVIAWVAFPLAMVTVSRLIKREKNYLGFIVAYNWASVLQNGVYLPLAILTVTGGVPADAGNFLNLILLALILAYTWFIAKTALDIPGPQAAAIVALDFALGIFINGVAQGIL